MTGITWHLVADTVTVGVAFYGIIRYLGVLHRPGQQMPGEWRIAGWCPVTELRSSSRRRRSGPISMLSWPEPRIGSARVPWRGCPPTVR